MSQILQRAGYQSRLSAAGDVSSSSSLSALQATALSQPQLLAMTEPTTFKEQIVHSSSKIQAHDIKKKKKKKDKKKTKVKESEEDRELQQCEPLVGHDDEPESVQQEESLQNTQTHDDDFNPSFPPVTNQ